MKSLSDQPKNTIKTHSVTQLKRLQQIQNALARAVTCTPKQSHITPITHNLLNKCQPNRSA